MAKAKNGDTVKVYYTGKLEDGRVNTTQSGKMNRIAKSKFFIGVLLIILSFILGKVALPALAINYYISLLIYAISWALLIGGIAMCGKKGWYMAKHMNKKYGNKVIECFKKPKS